MNGEEVSRGVDKKQAEMNLLAEFSDGTLGYGLIMARWDMD